MRGVNLNVFAFDFDLTWAALVLTADGQVLGRFGGRDARSADTYLTLGGFKHALRAGLERYRQRPPPPREPPPIRTVEQYPAAQKLRPTACIHCHNVYDYRREALIAAGTWKRSEVWVYPEPANVGLTLNPEQGDRVKAVAAGSAAGRAGLRTGDVLTRLNGEPVASYADAQHALHVAPEQGAIPVTWRRDGRELSGSLEVKEGWRQTDISWRGSMWNLEPSPCLYGTDLTAAEKQALGLAAQALAFRQNQFLSRFVRQAGIRAGDVIVGIDGKRPELTMLQFQVYVKLNYHTGDKVTLNVIRDGQRLDVPFTLPARP